MPTIEEIAAIPELANKTIAKVEVYSDAVLVTLDNGAGIAIFNTTDGLRLQVGSKSSDDMPLSVRVYPGNFRYPGNLPNAALRRSF
jgi:hypothetical protein